MEKMDQIIRTFYSKYSQIYDQRYPGPNPYTFALITQLVDINARILDVGCGDGRYLLPLLDQGYHNMTGIDVSTEMLNRLRGKLHSRTASAKIINGDILEFKFEEASFDVVLCLFGVLAHVHRKLRRSELLGKFHQLLNRGGYLFVSVPNVYRRFLYRQIQSYVLGRLRWRQYEGLETNDVLYYRRVMGERVRSYYHLYSAKGFKKELTDCGFAHVEVTSESILPEEFVLRRPRIASLCQLFQTTRWLNNLAYDLLAIATN